MALENLRTEVQVKLVEFAWDAAKDKAGTSVSAEAGVQQFVDLFGQALDGFARACESAGKEAKSQ